MTKSLMISIQPQHAINILNGKKTLELRSWIPKDYKGWVYVYITKNEPYLIWNNGNYVLYTPKINLAPYSLNGKVAFRFQFDGYDVLEYQNLWDRSDYIGNDGELSWEVDSTYLESLQLEYQDVLDYGFKTKPHYHQADLYAWHIKQLEVFDKPMKLNDFKTVDISKYQDEYGNPAFDDYFELTKAPKKMQWVYVNE